MSPLLVLSVWNSGHSRFVTFQELDEKVNTVTRLTWPITYAEGADLSEWATQKARAIDCLFTFSPDGWNVYMPIERVSEKLPRFTPLHNNSRTDPEHIETYRRLAQDGGYASLSRLG